MNCKCGGRIIAQIKRENTSYADYEGNIRQSFQVGELFIAGAYCEECKVLYHKDILKEKELIREYPYYRE